MADKAGTEHSSGQRLGNVFSSFVKTCCNTGLKQSIWISTLVFFLIVFVGVGAFVSRQNLEPVGDNSSGTTCDGELSFTDEETVVLQTIIIIGATLSCLGSSFIIFSYFYFVDLRTFPYKLIMFLSVADFFSSLTYIIGFQNEAKTCFESSYLCFFTAGITQFFDVASFFWMAVIVFNIWQILDLRKGPEIYLNEKYYHLVSWGIPALLLIIVTSTDALGDAGNWCWIRRSHPVERMLCYYVILMMIMVFNIVLYCRIYASLNDQNAGQKRAIMKRMTLYLLIFLFIRFWSVLNRVAELANGEHGIFPLMLLHSLFSPLQGFANAIVYGLNRKIKSQYAELCRGCCGMRMEGFGHAFSTVEDPHRRSSGGSHSDTKA